MRSTGYLNRSDGGSLRARLLAVVMVPLLGAGVLAVGVVGQRHNVERSARSVEVAVRAAVALDAARSALYQELLPELELAALNDPAEVKQLGPAANSLVRTGASSASASARAAADAALVAASRQLAVAAVVRKVQAEVRTARRTFDTHRAALTTASTLVPEFARELTMAEDQQIEEATKSGLVGQTATALQDVVLVARGVEVAEQEPELFAGSQVTTGAVGAGLREQWLSSWGAFQSTSTEIMTITEPAVRAAWTAMVNSAPFIAFDETIRPSLAADAPAPVATLTPAVIAVVLAAVTQDRPRDKALTAVLQLAADHAAAVASDQWSSAHRDLIGILGLSVVLVLLAVGVALLAYRSLARPLNSLSAQAKQVSLGELPDVAVAGPREVRTVARGLSAAVGSLRRIQHQAAAVSAGDLDDDIVREPVPGPLGRVVHESVSTIIDAIRERDEAQRDLAHVASHDALTELPNRAEALTLINRALHRGQRAQTMTGLMFLDLDRFKQVNDTFGHAAGDIVLQTAARRMLDVIRSGDTLARLGGDEFVILVEDIHNPAEFVELGERLIAALSHPMSLDSREVTIGASVGVAMCRDGYLDASRLLQEADAAVYKAKEEGRGRVGIFDDTLRQTLRERAELEAAISKALDEHEFLLHYQPVVDLATGRTLGVEALIRWERPGHGMVPPDTFIPTAELSHRINDIGRWVLAEATSQLAAWTAADSAAAELTVAVNVSGRHLISNTLVDDVRHALDTSGIEPARLVVEITETVLVDNPTAAVNMQLLRATGVKIAIDDFGTGFTSIGQLPRLPVDTLKIDRSFVTSKDPAQQELVRLIVSAAHAFNLTVVAEGVEHAHQVDSLRDAAAEVGQGYYFSRPQPAASFNPSAIAQWATG